MPQPVDYHDFADHRHVWGIRNFFDVFSNAAFLVVGIYGIYITVSGRAHFEYAIERLPYLTLFIGTLLTSVGSAYYHLSPTNDTLFWDRLPMTIAFMGLVCSQIVDRISIRGGILLLAPALAVGAFSVIYWRMTEQQGMGNVMPYAILQAYSVFILLLLAKFNSSRYSRGNDIYWVFAWYVLSKLLETFDTQFMEFIHGWVSGHTLKHLAAAGAAVVICRMLLKRTLKL